VFQQWGKCERLLNSGVSAMGKRRARNCGTVVFQQWGKGTKLLNSGVSAMEKVKKLLNSGVSAMKKEQKVVEQWCFSNGEACLFLK
jgi:hypothetical protein